MRRVDPVRELAAAANVAAAALTAWAIRTWWKEYGPARHTR